MTTNEKLAWATGAIAAVGLLAYSVILLTATSIAAPTMWLASAVSAAIVVGYVIVMRGHTPETDQQDAWTLGSAYRGPRVSRQMLIPVGGMALSVLLMQSGLVALASAMFAGVLAAMVWLSIAELLDFGRRHVAPRVSPAEIRRPSK